MAQRRWRCLKPAQRALASQRAGKFLAAGKRKAVSVADRASAACMCKAGLGTAVPARRYAQGECWEHAEDAFKPQQLSPRSRAVLRNVLLGQNGSETRHLAIDS